MKHGLVFVLTSCIICMEYRIVFSIRRFWPFFILDVSMQYDSEIRPNAKKNGSDKTNKFLKSLKMQVYIKRSGR